MSPKASAVIRAFVALELPDELQQRLEQISTSLREAAPDAPVRWVKADKIHLTLKFLGEVSLSHLSALHDILREVAAHHAPFEFGIEGVGAFPKPLRPRVIWVGVNPSRQMEALQREVDIETARLGYPRENRPFSPHLTLGRVSDLASGADGRAIAAALESIQVGFLGTVTVQAVHLFRSDLTPGGAVYTRLFSAPLQSNQT